MDSMVEENGNSSCLDPLRDELNVNGPIASPADNSGGTILTSGTSIVQLIPSQTGSGPIQVSFSIILFFFFFISFFFFDFDFDFVIG